MQERRVKGKIWFYAAAILSGFAGSAQQPETVGSLIYANIGCDDAVNSKPGAPLCAAVYSPLA
jgi:hypothetical protein